uniref:PIH1 domain-containing protein 2 n=1 Tax=Canis lupus familiaris TaxID=9615 RepID=A0A8I3MJ22_CANLF
MPRSRSSGTAPGPGRRSPEGLGTLRTGTPLAWAPTNTRSARRGEGRGRGGGEGRGGEASKWKAENTPPSLSPGSLPPSGHGARGNLPSKRPPRTNTHKHTHTVRRSLAWRGLGGSNRSGRQGSGLPFQAGSRAPEKRFPPPGDPGTAPHPPPPPPPPPPPGRVSSRLSRWKGAEAREAGAFLEKKWVGLSGKASPTPEGEDPGTGRENTVLPGAFRTQLEVVPGPVTVVTGVAVCQGTEGRDVYTVISVAYNPDVLQAAEKDQVKKDQLIRMAMKCIEEKFQFTLSHSYSITKFRIKGSIERMKQNLMGMQAHPTDLREKMRKELTFEEISSTLSNPDHFQLLLPKGEVSSKKRCLIEEISSTEIQVEMKEPTYELKIVADQKEKPQKIEIKVELPGINSVSLCDLSVSEDDLLIEVSEKYRLHLNLPESVNTEMTTAKFIKEKATLIITMPLV